MNRRADLLILGAVLIVLVILGVGLVFLNGTLTLSGQNSVDRTNQAVLTQLALLITPTTYQGTATDLPSISPSLATAIPFIGSQSTAGLPISGTPPLTYTPSDTLSPSPSPSATDLPPTPTLGAQERLGTAVARRVLEQLASTSTAAYGATVDSLAALRLAQTITLTTTPNTPIVSSTATPLLATLVYQRLAEVQTETGTAAYQATVDGIVNQYLTVTAGASISDTPLPTLTSPFTPTPTSLQSTLVQQRLHDVQTQTAVGAYQATVDGIVNQYLTVTAAAIPVTPLPTLTALFTPTPTPLQATQIQQRLHEVQTQTAAGAYQATVEGIVNQYLTVTAAAIPVTPLPTLTALFTPTPTPLQGTQVQQRLHEVQTQTAAGAYQATVEGIVNQYLTVTAAAGPSTALPSATPLLTFTPTPLLATLANQRLIEVQTQTAAAANQATVEGVVAQILTATAASLPSATPTPTAQLATLISQQQATVQGQTATANVLAAQNAVLNQPLTATAVGVRQGLIKGIDSLQTQNVGRIQALLTLKAHTKGVFSVAFSPLGDLLASVGDDNNVLIWDVRNGTVVTTIPGFSPRHTVAFSPDGRSLAYGSTDGTVRIWDLAAKAERLVLNGRLGEVTSIAFSRDGTMLAAGTAQNIIILWDPGNGNQLGTLKGHQSAVLSVAFNPDGSLLASGSLDSSIRLWDVRAQAQINILKPNGREVNSVAFSPDGSLLVSGNANGSVRIWNPTTGVTTLILKGFVSTVTSVAFSQDGSIVAAGGLDKTVRVWDAKTGALLNTLKGHTDQIQEIAFSPDGRRLASGSLDTTILLWAIPSK